MEKKKAWDKKYFHGSKCKFLFPNSYFVLPSLDKERGKDLTLPGHLSVTFPA